MATRATPCHPTDAMPLDRCNYGRGPACLGVGAIMSAASEARSSNAPTTVGCSRTGRTWGPRDQRLSCSQPSTVRFHAAAVAADSVRATGTSARIHPTSTIASNKPPTRFTITPWERKPATARPDREWAKKTARRKRCGCNRRAVKGSSRGRSAQLSGKPAIATRRPLAERHLPVVKRQRPADCHVAFGPRDAGGG
jgi:hypothetical protein